MKTLICLGFISLPTFAATLVRFDIRPETKSAAVLDGRFEYITRVSVDPRITPIHPELITITPTDGLSHIELMLENGLYVLQVGEYEIGKQRSDALVSVDGSNVQLLVERAGSFAFERTTGCDGTLRTIGAVEPDGRTLF